MLKFQAKEITAEDCKYTQVTMLNIKAPVDAGSSVNIDLQICLTPQQKQQMIKSLLKDSYL